ncbi:CHAT domain-containing protein [Longimicrobium sp.]|uniref:CHAT domain-containing protein n=1 Tax=Longimicrobium sp. TaxID=2029185 RepID=UPI002BF028FD|nr:CHAT domain-containing protein [Longimicrobium sp.]HSU17485.1 CHAT domain-containing protein [Longimicrobium sp.]
MSKLKILFFAADPLSLPPGGRRPRLRLDEDVRGIREKIRLSEYRDAVEVDLRLAARPDDLLQALYEVRPQVVHFSAHGWSEGLILMDPAGQRPHRVQGEALTTLFRSFPGNIRLVVLNACDSYAQAEAIAGVVGCAIGMRGEITDEAAITFGSSFYRAMGFGESIQAAFDQARSAVGLSHFSERDCPRLAAQPDIDPARLVLVSPTSRPPRAPGWTKRAVITLAVAGAAGVGAVYLRPDRNLEPSLPAPPSSPDSAAARVAPPPAAPSPVPDSAYRPPPLDESGNTVQNGGFQNRFAEWTRSADRVGGKGTNEIVSFADARSGYALHLTYEGRGSLLFTQKVSVPGPDYVFRGTFRASSHEGPMIGFSGTGIATVMLQYLDADGRFLGMTSFYSYVQNPLANTPLVGVPRRGNGGNNVHYIDVEKERLYKDYELDIRREIEENLLGVVAEQVRTVAIALYCGATDDGAGAELWVSDLSLRPRR